MKKVLVGNEQNVVWLDNLKENAIIGIETPHGARFAVFQDNIGYFATNNNFLGDRWKKPTLESYIDKFTGGHSDNFNIISFESPKELWKWMGE